MPITLLRHRKPIDPSDSKVHPKNSPLVAPLPGPRERLLQTVAMAAWLLTFLGSIGTLMFVFGLWLLVVFVVLSRWFTIVRFVYGDKAFYPTQRDRDSLAPKIADFVDVDLVLLGLELVVLTVLIVCFARFWRHDLWNTSQRRFYPTQMFNKQFSPEHEFITDAWYRKLFAAVYVRWSFYVVSYFAHRIIFDEEGAMDEDTIRDCFPQGNNYIFGCRQSQGMASVSLWSSFCWRPTVQADVCATQSSSFQKVDTPMRRFLEKYVVYGLDFGNQIAEKTPLEVSAHKRKAYSLVVHTASANFVQPFWRELALRVGLRDVCQGSILNSVAPVESDSLSSAERLERGHLSRISCVVVGGGSAESVDEIEFIRLCVETGACAVPVCTFCEDGLVDGSPHKITEITGVLRWMTSLVTHSPRRLTTVVGKPIFVERVARPNKGDTQHELATTFDAVVTKTHAQFITAHQALLKKHKEL